MFGTRESRIRWTLAAIGLATFLAMLALEVFTDDERITSLDFLGDALQMALVVATAVACALLAMRVQSQHEERAGLLRDLALARAEGEAWRREAQTHLEGLGIAIERQFEAWGLTPAEREIGLLMLKGFAHKEIGALRATSEATVRQQAKSIYQKAGVASRTAFCAFFLEDLLPAADTPTGVGASAPDRDITKVGI